MGEPLESRQQFEKQQSNASFCEQSLYIASPTVIIGLAVGTYCKQQMLSDLLLTNSTLTITINFMLLIQNNPLAVYTTNMK